MTFCHEIIPPFRVPFSSPTALLPQIKFLFLLRFLDIHISHNVNIQKSIGFISSPPVIKLAQALAPALKTDHQFSPQRFGSILKLMIKLKIVPV
jgi:hypothetical protein